MRQALRILFVAFWAWQVSAAQAGDSKPTSNLYGMIGLNTVPSARMDKAGTVHISAATADPYFHTSLGLQIHERLFVSLRQSSEMSGLLEDPKKVFPGLDLKFKLFDEKTFRPEIAIGLQSAFGHKRMAGEYLAFSKRYEQFDFTAGFGWGRFGTRQSAPNPLDWTASYFDKDRELDGENPNSPKDWFTGGTGFFAGIEYATPLKGLRLKADWSSDAYKAERQVGIDAPWAYSFGLNYQPTTWMDTGIALMDSNTVMARVSLKSTIADWPFSSSRQNKHVPLIPSQNTDIAKEGEKYALRIRNIRPEQNSVAGQIYLNGHQSAPYQLSQSWRIITNSTSKKNPDTLKLEPIYFGLKAPAVTIMRQDLVEAGVHHNGSAEEIWRNLEFDKSLSSKKSKIEGYIPSFKLRENFSLSEDDGPFIHRTDIIATVSQQIRTNFLSETSFRYNLFSNLDHLDQMRLPSKKSIRSDEAYYAQHKLAIERSFLQGFKSFSTDWHVTGSTGYLDEIFAGYHGEILYRPWGKNWALGLEAANVIKRDYAAPLNLGFIDQSKYTGHVNFYYEFPNTDTTLHASLGQYVGQDKGGTLTLKNRFDNGAKLEAFITATNMHDPDPYGGNSNLSSGVRFSLPLGSLKYIPDGSGIEINAVPVARNAGQKIDIAHPLHDMTEILSYRHLTQRWMDVTQ